MIPTILSKYKLEGIYNADEFGLSISSRLKSVLEVSWAKWAWLACQPEMPLAKSCQCSLLINLQNHNAFLGSKICLADTGRKKSWMDCDLFE